MDVSEKPMALKISIALAFRFILNIPSESEKVPCFDFFTLTEAEMTGSPFVSVTLPVTEMSCAERKLQRMAKNKKNKVNFFISIKDNIPF
jgi:hypothetical protein